MPYGRSLFHCATMLTLLLFGPFSATAATITWNATTGDWSEPANWGGTLPTPAD